MALNWVLAQTPKAGWTKLWHFGKNILIEKNGRKK
jgi:hypothetical protein